MEKKDGFPTPKSSSATPRISPLPQLSWGDPDEVWDSLITKNEIYNRDHCMLLRHSYITPRMRSILFDWLSEVSELFTLLRETYYSAMDFVDRYLSIKNNVPRQQLQLLGITCLFIAAKIEEVYPPKLKDLAYITDGACSEAEIIKKELVVMESLNWSLIPVTVNKWLCVFMQLYSINEKENNVQNESINGDKLLLPSYSTSFFSQIAHLVDLCMLDIGSLRFSYDVIAAAAFFHFIGEETVYKCTRLTLSDIEECVIWMTPFALAINEIGFKEPNHKNDNEFWSDLQYHTADLALLEKAHNNQLDLQEEVNNEVPMPPSPVSSPSTSAVKGSGKRKCDHNNNTNNGSAKKRKITMSEHNVSKAESSRS